ncbi:leucine--tRNA ligase [Candidatus Riflebacteria bacterium]
MAQYDFSRIEKEWQKNWEESGIYHCTNDSSRPKFFGLIEFPYPSGDGLHVGHPRSYTAMDVICRKKRMQGYNVLFPIGFDSFGLPTENFAVKTGIHPLKVTKDNIENFTRQLKMMGFSFDWSREVKTSEPNYYKWTQFIFLRLFKKGLAYQASIPVNWCPALGTILANEEVIDGKSDVGGHPVFRKPMRQWLLKITAYADRLIGDLTDVNYLEKIKAQQIHWIGRSEGAEIRFPITGFDKSIEVYTTRPDTVFGATYMVLSPEHELLQKLKEKIHNWQEVEEYIQEASSKSDLERTELSKDKTGIELKGVTAFNPATEKEIPIFVADYVLISYGTGAIMSVPGHDQRDWEFAKKFNLPIIEVISGGDIETEAFTSTDEGILVNSGFLNGLPVKEAIDKTISWLRDNSLGAGKVNYKLRDWVFSRQRYWGEPIPIYYPVESSAGTDLNNFDPRKDDSHRVVYEKPIPLEESELPLVLPEIQDFKPTLDGEPPLARCEDWVYFQKDGNWFARETNTMPQWAGSSWYFLRYCDPHNNEQLASKECLDYWMPVDWYNGGMEHTTLHLLYSRFWHKFLFDEGLVKDKEPYSKRTSHGVILGEDNQKMSKSRGNVVNPDEVVKQSGADTMRCFEMFIGAFDQMIPWSNKGVNGVHKFLNRVWNLLGKVDSEVLPNKEDDYQLHKTIKNVSERIESMKFNTAVSELMTYSNYLGSKAKVVKEHFNIYLKLLSVFAPHIACELWSKLGNEEELTTSCWPEWSEEKLLRETFTLAVQVNGKLRDTLEIELSADKQEIANSAKSSERVKKHIAGKNIIKEIYVPKKIYNIVAR